MLSLRIRLSSQLFKDVQTATLAGQHHLSLMALIAKKICRRKLIQGINGEPNLQSSNRADAHSWTKFQHLNRLQIAPLRPDNPFIPEQWATTDNSGWKKQSITEKIYQRKKKSQASNAIQENLSANSCSSSNCSKSINKAKLLLHWLQTPISFREDYKLMFVVSLPPLGWETV